MVIDSTVKINANSYQDKFVKATLMLVALPENAKRIPLLLFVRSSCPLNAI
jgi:hypothetical protein